MRKLLSYFCCLIIVFNQITTSVNAANILQKTKIHKITNCESVLNSSFETYIDCLNEEIFSSKRFNRLSPNKKNDILSLLAIANILHENIEDNFLDKKRALNLWNQILKQPYKGKIKNKSLQKILEGSNCLDKKVYKVFITCFADEFRNFEIYRNSDLLNKRRIETIMINAQFLTRSYSEVFVETKKKMKEDKIYTSEDGFNFFFTMMDRLGTDYFIKQKKDISWEKVITFIIIAIIVAYVAKGLLKSSGSGSTASTSSSSSSVASSSGSSLSTSGVAAKGSFGTNMFRYAPANSVLHKPWFKYTFARGGFF